MKFSMPLLLVALLSAHCNRSDSSKPEPTGDRQNLTSIEEFRPNALPYTSAALVLAGTVIPVQMKETPHAGKVTFLMTAHGETLEEESYVFDSSAFRIAGAAGETYEPAITLLRFPMRVGDEWVWNGEMESGSVSRPARAKVTTKSEPLNIPGVASDSVRVAVELEMDSGAPTPAIRTLTFWFVSGKGVVKREFGASSTRQPLEESR